MNEVAFIQQREPDWQRLSYLSDRADLSPASLSGSELQDFIRLYRKCSSDLALARTKSNNLQLIDFLNDLVGRAYATLYRGKRKNFWVALLDGAATAARTVRRRKWFLTTSAGIFIVSIIFTYWACGFSPRLRDIIEPPSIREEFKPWTGDEPMGQRTLAESLLYSSFYSSNNPRVAIIQSAIGAATFGFGSAYMTWSNGQILGSLSYEMQQKHKLPHLYIWIMPHGVTELSGLIVSCSAGLVMGWALIVPGRRKRRDALREASKDGLVLLCTSVVLMFMAAPVEGFFSFNPSIPDWMKVGFAVFAAATWSVFWTGYAREPIPSLSQERSAA